MKKKPKHGGKRFPRVQRVSESFHIEVEGAADEEYKTFNAAQKAAFSFIAGGSGPVPIERRTRYMVRP